MKERVTCLLLSLLLASLVLFSGCSKVKEIDEISGPTWVTSLTMPLVTRNVEEGYEIRLGDASNAQGEEGLGLTGNSLYSYKPDDEEEPLKWEETLDTVEVELGPILDFNLNNTIADTEDIPAGTLGAAVELTDTDLAGVKLSNHHSEGAYNDITITLTNGSAGSEGLHFSLVDYEGGVAGDDVIESPVTIPKGDTTGHLNLSGADIPPNMYITVEGAVEATAPNAGITFTGSTLEIAAVTFSGEKSGALFGLEETIDLGEIDLGEDLPMITLETASLEFVHDFPDNIQVTATLVVEGRDEFGGSMDSSDSEVTLSGTGSTAKFQDELNDVLNSRPSSLAFSFTNIGFSPITGDEVEVELGGEISLEVTPEIGFETITTDPEEMEVPEDIKENPLQAFMMYLNVANNSPAGFDLTVHLSPDPIPLDDDNENKVEISFSVEPAVSGEPGVFDNTDDPIILTTAQLDYLTSGDLFYNQIEFTNKSEPGVILDDHYIEIRSWARVDVLVNKKEEEEE